MQDCFMMNNQKVWQPDSEMAAAWETTFTEDSTRVQSGRDHFTPLFTIEQYSYSASNIPVAEATKIIQMVLKGKPVLLHYWSVYHGRWRDDYFRVGKSQNISIGTLINGGEMYSKLAFNMTGVNPVR